MLAKTANPQRPCFLGAQVASLLKELQSEQARLRVAFEQQSATVSMLQSDILLARRCG